MLIIREKRCFDRTSGVSGISPLLFYVPFPSDALGVKESSLRAGKWISSCSQSLRLPSGGCLVGAATWLDRKGRLQKKMYSFLEAEGLTHSLVGAIVDRMLSTGTSSMPTSYQ